MNNELELKKDHPVIKRLLEELKEEKKNGISSYNRLHNRHNRTPGPRPLPPTPEIPQENE